MTVVAALPGLSLSPLAMAQNTPQPSQVPDAPSPQPQQAPLSSLSGPIKPGGGAEAEGTSGSADLPMNGNTTVAPPSKSASQQPTPQETPPEDIKNAEQLGTIIHTYTTFVNVPVTVKDNKGKLVAGLTWRDFKVYENGSYQPLRFFSVSAMPLSISFVIDQSVTRDVMQKVNDSLGAIQGALAPYDEVAIFTYSNGAQNRSGGFTGAQSARVPFVLSMAKASGTEEAVPVNSGPFASCNVRSTATASIPTCSRDARRATARSSRSPRKFIP